MNSETLQRWALSAEILGGVAVVVTLVFLVLETRENTNAIQAQTYQSQTAELNAYRRFAIEQDLLDLQARMFQDSESLSFAELFQFRTGRTILWGIYESAFYAQKRGVLGDAEWSRFLNGICRNRLNDDPIWGTPEDFGTLAPSLTEDFLQFVNSSCNEGEIIRD